MTHDAASKCFAPVAFILCTAKSYDTYWNLLQHVASCVGQKLKPKEVVCDFELALIRAVGDWFPKSRNVGCLLILNRSAGAV